MRQLLKKGGQGRGKGFEAMRRFASLTGDSRYRIYVILQGVAVGWTAGLVSILYRVILGQAERFSLLAISPEGPIPMAGLIALWTVAAYVIGRIMEWEPLSRGSGIPQVQGELLGRISMKWWRVLTAKILGGGLAIALGLSLGREGPSIQLGAAAGKGVARVQGKSPVEEQLMITSGSSAGLSAAFNAPLAGVIFALEELHKSFSPLILLSAMTASLVADMLSKNVFGLGPVFSFGVPKALPLGLYGYLLALGVLCGVVGALFCRLILGMQDLYGKMSLPPRYTVILPALAAIPAGLCLPLVLGGGHPMVEYLATHHSSLGFITALFLVNMLFTALSFGSGAPGGIFFPMLANGAALGALYGTAVSQFFGIDPGLMVNFLVVAMAGFFTAVVRAPITGIVLITEMSGSFTHLLSVALVSLAAHMTADLLRVNPIYDSLLTCLISGTGEGDPSGRVLIEQTVCPGSFLDGRKVGEVPFPKGCLLVGVQRGEWDILPDGETKLQGGDRITALVDGRNAQHVKEVLLERTGVPCRSAGPIRSGRVTGEGSAPREE